MFEVVLIYCNSCNIMGYEIVMFGVTGEANDGIRYVFEGRVREEDGKYDGHL
jgi:hypothetical protein